MARNESVRMASALRDILVQRGGNFSAATRAYIYIGMAAAGDDLEPFTKDIRLLLCEPLAQTVHERLERLITKRPTPVVQPSYIPSFDPPPPLDLSNSYIPSFDPPPPLDLSNSYEIGFEF